MNFLFKNNTIKKPPVSHYVIWIICRCLLFAFGIYGLFTDSVTEYLMGMFALGFTHLWDLFQLIGGKSFISRLDHFSQTLLSCFLVWSCLIYWLNVNTNIKYLDNFSHLFAGFMASWFWYDFITVMQGKKHHIKPAVAALSALLFAISISTAWEFYEFTMDRVYGYMLQTSDLISERGLVDTMTDLIEGTIGGLVGMFISVFYRVGIIGPGRKEKRKFFREQSKKDSLEERKLYEEERLKEKKSHDSDLNK